VNVPDQEVQTVSEVSSLSPSTLYEGLVRAPKSARLRHLRRLSLSEETSKRPLSCRTNCSIAVFLQWRFLREVKYSPWLAEISTEISWQSEKKPEHGGGGSIGVIWPIKSVHL
jgi:hypothetical protein